MVLWNIIVLIIAFTIDVHVHLFRQFSSQICYVVLTVFVLFANNWFFFKSSQIESTLIFQVKKQIHDAGFLCDTDVDHSTTLNKKIRNAQLSQYNFILGK